MIPLPVRVGTMGADAAGVDAMNSGVGMLL